MKSCDQFDRYLREKLPESGFRRHCESCAECRQAFELDRRLLELAAGLRWPDQAPAAAVWQRVIERTARTASSRAAAAISGGGVENAAPDLKPVETGDELRLPGQKPAPPGDEPAPPGDESRYSDLKPAPPGDESRYSDLKPAETGDEVTPPGLKLTAPGAESGVPGVELGLPGARRADSRRQSGVSAAGWPGMLSAAHMRPLWRIAALLFLALAGFLYYRQQQPLPVKGLLAEKALQRVEAAEADYLQAIAGLEAAAGPRLTALPPDLASLYRTRLEAIDAQIIRCREALAANPANAHIRRYLLAALQDKKETLRSITAAAIAS